MKLNFNNFFTKYLTFYYWKLFPQNKIQTIQKFSSVEYDSCWQLLNAIPKFQDSFTRSQLFKNALEELRHGQLFENEFNRQSITRSAIEIGSRKPLIHENPNEEELRTFLMFFHIGEEDVCRKFKMLSTLPLEPSLQNIFLEIVNDEEIHGAGCYELIRNRGATEDDLKNLEKANWWSNKKEEITRFIKKFDWPIFLGLTTSYYVFGFFIHKSLKNRFNLNRNDQLIILQEQVAEHIESIKNI